MEKLFSMQQKKIVQFSNSLSENDKLFYTQNENNKKSSHVKIERTINI